MLDTIRLEFCRHRWMGPGLALTGGAAFGSALPDLLALLHRVLS